MSFRDNLQHLRAARGMTQEQLAMLLGVSRQSVTKWEAERAYPEMDKLLKLCSLFGCTLDELVQGDLSSRPAPESASAPAPAVPPQDVCGYDEHMRARAARVATVVSLLIAGTAAYILFEETLTPQRLADTVSFGALALALIAALAIAIPTGMGHRAFVKAHPFVEDFYTCEDCAAGRRTLALGIVGGLACLCVGFAAMLLLEGADPYNVVALLGGAAAGAWPIVYGGLMSARLDLGGYNRDAAYELSDDDIAAIVDEERRRALATAKRGNDLIASVGAVIMLVATAAGLAFLFVPAIRSEFFWLAWVFGAILWGAAAVVIQTVVRSRG